jgi:hypothetical protein
VGSEPLDVHALTPVVLAGCVPQAAPGASWMHGFSVIGVQQIDTVVDVVEETLKGDCLFSCFNMQYV